MRRRANKQRDKIILSVFVPTLLAATAFFIYLVTTGESANSPNKAEKGKATRTTASKPTAGKPQPSGYTVIAQRNIFEPLVAPKVTVTPQPTKPRPVPPPTRINNTPPTFFPTMPTEEVRNPTVDRIAVVGTVTAGNETFVLVEDVAKGETRQVRAGESVFGYTVRAAGVDDAVLERDGRTYKVAMGEGKANVPIRSAMTGRGFNPAVGAPNMNGAAFPLASPAMPGGMPDLANMSSDQRRQWFDQWRNSLGNMSPEQQEQARQQMRDYWRQQAGGGGGGFGGGGGDRGGDRRFNPNGGGGFGGGDRGGNFGGGGDRRFGSTGGFGGGGDLRFSFGTDARGSGRGGQSYSIIATPGGVYALEGRGRGR